MFQERMGDPSARDARPISCAYAFMFIWTAALGCVYQEGACMVLFW